MFCFLLSRNKNVKKNTGIYAGSLENETDVLDWMIDQKTDESIEEIDRETLFEYIGSKDFLAVLFCMYLFACIKMYSFLYSHMRCFNRIIKLKF